MVQHSHPPGPTAAGPTAAGPPTAVGPSQSQQPILNDALSYLDQVKIQFTESPDVYNRFLDIMKEFKSGSIDTPGVIDRVSSLFADHPDLIQGFNTFLPQGYKIECGLHENPNSILVTTPMGSTVITMPSSRRLSNPRPVSVPVQVAAPAPPVAAPPPAPGPAGYPRPPVPSTAPPSVVGVPPAEVAFVHEQGPPQPPMPFVHGVDNRVHNVVPPPNPGPVPSYYSQSRPSFSPPPPTVATTPITMHFQSMNGQPPQRPLSPSADRRPVEFNHAISYVNKIKNRFATQPDIYKQFLEILQTYQRESKPIQDVYAQVTKLFETAPDLLDDFKQFLPESAASARAHRARLEEAVTTSDLRGDPGYHAAAVSIQTSIPEVNRLPPVGTFAPTPVPKDGKRKRGEKGPPTPGLLDPLTRPQFSQTNNINGRGKSGPTKTSSESFSAPISPTLIPALPEPLAPLRMLLPLPDELAFFDRAKKFISSKASFNEFLKLLHLFNKDLIDKSMLVYRAHAYIGGNPELYDWFKKFVQYDDTDVVDARGHPTFGRVALANCRGLGPSYRLLPKRQTHAPCKGRDTLCRSVLNDKWISHPTWASEDSGFVAHRKNVYEEGLHRIEEERHEYDFNIEAISRTIQLLQPIAQSLRVMSPADRKSFTLDPGLGGQSHTIYQRVIKRLYGREKGGEVITDMFRRPYAVIPPLLTRLQAKCEDWKAAQREWEKVWREQTQKIFWKGLDHQHAQQKNADKRQFQAKTLFTEIQVKYEEQKRRREINRIPQSSYQLSFDLPDKKVVLDAAYLLLVHAEAGSSGDFVRLEYFIKEFIPLFFGIDPRELENRISQSSGLQSGDSSTEDGDEDMSTDENRVNGSKKKSSLLQGVLDPTRSFGHRDVSQQSTPASSVAPDDPMDIGDANSISSDSAEPSSRTWINLSSDAPGVTDEEARAMQPFSRSVFHMYCNMQIYCFFRTFVTFYDRLSNLKAGESLVREAVRRGQAPKPARDLRMLDKLPEEFWSDTSSTASYYQQVLSMFEDHIHGSLPMSEIEETLRRYYLQHGWQLYSFDKLLQALTRFALAIVVEDGKDRTHDIYQLFRKDRVRDKSTFKDELGYRKQVERYVRDGDVFRISYNPTTHKCFASILRFDDSTLDIQKMETERRWNYYVSSYQTLDSTEHVDYESITYPYLKRNIPTDEDVTEDFISSVFSGCSEDRLEVRICLDNYRLNFSPHREEWWVASPDLQLMTRQQAMHPAFFRNRNPGLIAKQTLYEMPAWMAVLDEEQRKLAQSRFQEWCDGGAGPNEHTDVVMSG